MWWVWWRAAVAWRDRGDLVAEPGQGLLMVAGEVLVVALVAAVVVVRRLKIAVIWPWAPAIITAWQRVTTLPQAP